ncbi:MAG: sigma-70 family RNA polymerase sigma factor [Terracidiphilus sp.]|jgi:RNA polymerase sigma-70 factor (ECF subfamily)
MSSEAAYFPDSLASAPDTLVPGHLAHDAFPDILDEAQTIGNETEEQPAARVIQTPELSDSLLLNRVAQGDKDALSILFRRHAHVVFSVACRILRDESEAEDLVQELFLFFFQKAGLFDAGKSPGASWIIQMAYQRAIDRRRYLDVRHHYSVHEFDEERSATSRGQISIDQVAGRALLDRFRREISTEQRQTLELHLFEGYSFREIAARTGQTFGNIRNHYYRGIERLRSYVFPKE